MADINDKKLDIIANIADKNPKKAIKRISELKLYKPVDDTLMVQYDIKKISNIYSSMLEKNKKDISIKEAYANFSAEVVSCEDKLDQRLATQMALNINHDTALSSEARENSIYVLREIRSQYPNNNIGNIAVGKLNQFKNNPVLSNIKSFQMGR